MTIHVSEENGESVEGAEVTVEQISKDFPIGSAISKTILGNIPYQVKDTLYTKNKCRLIKPLLPSLNGNCFFGRNGSSRDSTPLCSRTS